MTIVSDPQYESEIDLDRYRRFVVDHWRALAGGVLVGATLAVALGLAVPLRFEAAATLTILPPPAGAPSAELTQAGARGLLATPGLMSDAVEQLGLARGGVTAEQLAAAVDLQPLPAPKLVRLSVVLRDPATARAAVTLLAEKMVAASAKETGQAASRLRASLEKPLADAERRLKDAEARLARVLSSTPDEAFDMPFDATAVRFAERFDTRRTRRSTSAERRTDLYGMRLEITRLQAENAQRLSLYTSLRARYEEAAGAAVDSPQLQVIDLPVHASPKPRKRRQEVMLGSAVGLIGGIVLALVRERRRRAGR